MEFEGILDTKDGLEEEPQSVRILIVDDDKLLRDVLVEALELNNYLTDTAEDGLDALNKINSTAYDIVITDIKMPRMNGLELIKEVKKQNKDTDLIVMTGYASVDSAIESMKNGAIDYLVKPFNLDLIEIVINKTLENKRLKKMAEEMEFYRNLSLIDALTDCYNYRYLQSFLNAEIPRAYRYGHSVSLLMIDVDDFKVFNDLYGHPVGDNALKKVADALKMSCRNVDKVFRYGGEEFCIVLPETNKKRAFTVAERGRKAIESMWFQGEEKLPLKKLTITIGVATFPEDSNNKDDLITKADFSLYKGKKSGKNCSILYESTLAHFE
ncbi:MAG: diguanylate cyclase [Thermodesulfobacteriota bacterium]|nr:diguanylate cyclase [Thermodesulfobacteriota bacterium]